MDVYNDIGILRDVVQNHLTELLALIAMDLPSDSGNISALLSSKARVLRQLRPATEHSTLTAQYSTYNVEWMKDDATKNVSTVPTFSATALFVDNARWSGVPFVLVSGKKLDEKSSYVRIRFKDARFCARGVADQCDQRKQLVFNIGGGSSLRLPAMIAASRGLPAPRLRPGWTEIEVDDDATSADDEIFGQAATEMVRFMPDVETNPYAELLEAALDGTRTAFTSTEQLLASWRTWTAVLRATENRAPRQYLGRGKDAERLDFVVTSRGDLRWHLDDRNAPTIAASDRKSDTTEDGTFRNQSLVTGSATRVVRRLAEEIAMLADEAGSEEFHLAVSGGPNAAELFETLAEVVASWENVHLWMVDERCAAQTSEHSNFNRIQRHLLGRVKIPHWNVHPMLVGIFSSEACAKDDQLGADRLYESVLRERLPDASFDFVFLGMGIDGHTASLFPHHESLQEAERLVTYSSNDAVKDKDLRNRVTLTYKAINAAKNVAVLVLGSAKSEIVNSVADATDATKYPILGVNPASGVLKWFIDRDALSVDKVA